MKSVNEKYIREAIGELLHLLWAQQCCLSRSPRAAVGAKAGTDDSFAYQTLPGTYPGRTMLSFSAPQAASEGKSALLIQLKACCSSTRLWAPAEHQPKFAQGLQPESAVPHRAHYSRAQEGGQSHHFLMHTATATASPHPAGTLGDK